MHVFKADGVSLLEFLLDCYEDDLILCGCQSTEADYEHVPVEAYGLAMLKGMGWKKTEGIGRTFKQ